MEPIRYAALLDQRYQMHAKCTDPKTAAADCFPSSQRSSVWRMDILGLRRG